MADRPDEEIVRALTDAPEGTNLAESPLGRRILYEEDHPSRWAFLCHQARQLLERQGLGIEPSRRHAELAVEEANGMRRMPVGTWSLDRVEELLRIAEAENERLPAGDPIRLDLENRRLYHGGQAAIAAGDFGKAAEYYRAAAAIAATPFSQGLNTYFVAYCQLQDALARGDEEITRARYYAFSGESEQFITALNRSDEMELRWLGNVRCHQRMFDWLCGDETRIANILSLVEVGELEPRAAFRDALELLGAIYLSRQGRLLSVLACREAQSLAHNQGTALEWRALAFLFLAEMEGGGGEQGRARATLNKLINLDGHGGHVARAIARRRLGSLTE